MDLQSVESPSKEADKIMALSTLLLLSALRRAVGLNNFQRFLPISMFLWFSDLYLAEKKNAHPFLVSFFVLW